MNTRALKWLQIHLSTAIASMLAAGALMWANLIPTFHEPLGQIYIGSKFEKRLIPLSQVKVELEKHGDQWIGGTNLLYGWPTTALNVHHVFWIGKQGDTGSQDANYWPEYGLLINISVAIMLLSTVLIGGVWLIRIKARRLN
jgi:hypothetical protein